MTQRIWFNRWFSVMYQYMQLIRNNEDRQPYYICGTHPNPNHMSLQACDYREQEPVLSEAEYVEYCLDFCKRNHIDVFIPRLHMLPIAKQIQQFQAIGTKVMVCSDMELLHNVMDKHRCYETIGQELFPVPDYYIVNNVEQFKAAYVALRAKGHTVCFKPTKGEGGVGFQVIANEPSSYANPFQSGFHQPITFEQVEKALKNLPSFEDVMVMEWMNGDEYSIDCLADEDGTLQVAIPRKKLEGRLRFLENNEQLIDFAQRFAKRYRLPYIYNIQMIYQHGTPKLLEINPRMSGGLHYSCLSGVNFPYLAVRLATGHQIPPSAPQYGVLAGYVEQSIIMKNDF